MRDISRAYDLVLQRVVDIEPHKVWLAWTDPMILMRWFTPAPWTAVECEIDLRPGGIFRTLMQSPEGKTFPHTGCHLEIAENERLVWTTALLPGFRPAPAAASVPVFTAVIAITPAPGGTLYVATPMHSDEASRKAHEQMGFPKGWGAALDQFVAVAKTA